MAILAPAVASAGLLILFYFFTSLQFVFTLGLLGNPLRQIFTSNLCHAAVQKIIKLAQNPHPLEDAYEAFAGCVAFKPNFFLWPLWCVVGRCRSILDCNSETTKVGCDLTRRVLNHLRHKSGSHTGHCELLSSCLKTVHSKKRTVKQNKKIVCDKFS